MKLFSNNDLIITKIPYSTESYTSNNQSLKSLYNEYDKLSYSLNSLLKVQSVYISSESLPISNSNYIIYNEYIKSITRNLDIPPISTITLENLNNQEIALEGLIANVWNKIKEVFRKIYETITKFFKTYFTKLGRIKKKLDNIEEVLSETEKDLDANKIYQEQVPSSIANKLPYEVVIDKSFIQEIFRNVETLVNSISSIKDKALAFSKKEILDKDIVSKIEELKRTISAASSAKNEAKKEKENLGKLEKINPLSSKKKELNEKIGKLSDTIKEAEKEKKEKESTIKEVVDKTGDIDSEEAGKEEANKEYQEFINSVFEVLEKVKDKKLPKGIVITKVSIEEDRLEIETDENKDTPKELNLTFRKDILTMVKNVKKLIETSENNFKQVSEIIDNYYNSIESVNKIIADIDKYGESLNNPNLNKYKNILMNKVKHKLNIARDFFKSFSQVNKNFYDYTISMAEVIVEYSVVSMKYFN